MIIQFKLSILVFSTATILLDPVKYCITWLKAGHHSALDKETGKPAKKILPETRHSIFK